MNSDLAVETRFQLAEALSLPQPRRGGILKSNSYVRVVRIAFSVTLKHQDPDQVLGWIGPTLRAERSTMAERSGRQDAVGVHLRGVFHHDKTQSPGHPG